MWLCFGDGFGLEGNNNLDKSDIDFQFSLICFVWCEGHTKIDEWTNCFS